jgi:hypothetical protein
MDGDVSNGLLNSPSSVVFYNSTSFPSYVTRTIKPVLLRSKSLDCINSIATNYTSCQEDNQNNNDTDIDPYLIKLIYSPPNDYISDYSFQVKIRFNVSFFL